jgi:hypothetical protein
MKKRLTKQTRVQLAWMALSGLKDTSVAGLDQTSSRCDHLMYKHRMLVLLLIGGRLSLLLPENAMERRRINQALAALESPWSVSTCGRGSLYLVRRMRTCVLAVPFSKAGLIVDLYPKGLKH